MTRDVARDVLLLIWLGSLILFGLADQPSELATNAKGVFWAATAGLVGLGVYRLWVTRGQVLPSRMSARVGLPVLWTLALIPRLIDNGTTGTVNVLTLVVFLVVAALWAGFLLVSIDRGFRVYPG